jgi:hypothetical protein
VVNESQNLLTEFHIISILLKNFSTIDFEIMKERRSFKQNLKIRESGRSGTAGRVGRLAIGEGVEGPGGRGAGSSLHQCKKTGM